MLPASITLLAATLVILPHRDPARAEGQNPIEPIHSIALKEAVPNGRFTNTTAILATAAFPHGVSSCAPVPMATAGPRSGAWRAPAGNVRARRPRDPTQHPYRATARPDAGAHDTGSAHWSFPRPDRRSSDTFKEGAVEPFGDLEQVDRSAVRRSIRLRQQACRSHRDAGSSLRQHRSGNTPPIGSH